jgi:hypothetical protein
MEERDIINEAIDQLTKLTGEDFHGYRSEVWGLFASVIKESKETQVEERSENIDTSSGDIYPVNSKIQGNTFEDIKNFIVPRCRQLIKKVSYTFEVEYHPELKDDAILGEPVA